MHAESSLQGVLADPACRRARRLASGGTQWQTGELLAWSSVPTGIVKALAADRPWPPSGPHAESNGAISLRDSHHAEVADARARGVDSPVAFRSWRRDTWLGAGVGGSLLADLYQGQSCNQAPARRRRADALGVVGAWVHDWTWYRTASNDPP
ncbi:MAG: hypothetical protein DRJ50_12600, partial [Actinobacteria bacterium]